MPCARSSASIYTAHRCYFAVRHQIIMNYYYILVMFLEKISSSLLTSPSPSHEPKEHSLAQNWLGCCSMLLGQFKMWSQRMLTKHRSSSAKLFWQEKTLFCPFSPQNYWELAAYLLHGFTLIAVHRTLHMIAALLGLLLHSSRGQQRR